MANERTKTQEAGRLFRQLLEKIPEVAPDILRSLLNISSAPITKTAEFLGEASVPSSTQLTEQAQQKLATLKDAEKQLGPIQQNVINAIKKTDTKNIEEAKAAGVPNEQIAQTAGIPTELVQPVIQPETGQPPQQPQQFQQQPQILQPQGLFTGQGLTPGGNIQLGGKLAMGGQSLEQIELLQKLVGQQPLQVGEREKVFMSSLVESFKQDRLDQREVIKAGLKGDDTQKNAQLFQDDIFNLVDAFVQVPIKGRGRATLSALGGAIGIGREQRARFRAMQEVFPFRAAEFIAQQTARALSDKDFERIKVLSQFKLGAGESKTIGQLQALLDFTNSRLRAAGKSPLPDAKTFLKQVRSGQGRITTQQQLGETVQRVGRFSVEVE